jgi:hypothetical protein
MLKKWTQTDSYVYLEEISYMRLVEGMESGQVVKTG